MSERFVSARVRDVPPSGIRRFFDIAGSMENVISLGIGEPDFVTPYHARNAMINSLLDGETQYTANTGLIALREEIAAYLAARFHLRYQAAQEILVTVGASEAIDISLRAVLEPGDEVIIPDPGYVSYSPSVIFCHGKAVMVPTRAENGFEPLASDMAPLINPKTKVILLSFPNNPTGAVLSEDNMKAIAQLAIRHDLLLICDEIYNELTYDSFRQISMASLPGMWERTVTINGFSKAFAMTGLRIGYVAAPAALMQAIAKIHQYVIMCAPRQSQVAALAALRKGREDDYEDIALMRDSYDRRRRLMYDAFLSLGLPCVKPRGAFYMFPSIKKTGLSSEVFCERLLADQALVCIPGNAFGSMGEGYIRCCYATATDKLLQAFERLKTFLDRC
ncbi:MAG: aminotransferase class I/II-fold pyridoxal phosphate-dependent enzyme [Christensenellales bacterium]